MVLGPAKLFLGQLMFETTSNDLWRLFSAYGDVQDVQVLWDRERGVSKGAAFVTFGSTEDADTAVASLHNRYPTLPGRFMQVSYAKNSPNISPYGHHVSVDVAVNNGSNPMPGSVPRNGPPTPPPQYRPAAGYRAYPPHDVTNYHSSNGAAQPAPYHTHDQRTS